jgi:membrane associated rhomboid family serine protease
MRRDGFNARRSATLILLVVLAAVFVLQLAAERWFGLPYLDYLALSSDGLRHGMVWQLFTFQFLHGNWLHLLLNGWAIYVFGRELEETIGVKRYLALYLLSGVAGGLLQAVAGLLVPRWFAGPVVGASAGVFGLIAAYASLHPERPLTLLLFFVIPVTLRAKYLLLLSAIIALLGILFPGGQIAHAAHLGGMIGGMAFVKHAMDWRWPRTSGRARPPAIVPMRSTGGGSTPRRGPETPPPDDFLSAEVDPILDKISAQGIQSLTEREREILESARKKMRR